MAGISRKLSVTDRFFLFVKKTENCWIWQGHLNNKGYGQFRVKGIRTTASRVAFEIFKNPIPSGMHVLHKCDNPRSVNPEHLFIGTNQENVEDKVRKDRQLKGSSVGNSKLKEKDVIAIRLEVKKHKTRHSDIAERYGVSRALITLIINNKRWAHLNRAQGVGYR